MYSHVKQTESSGLPLDRAGKAIIMLHGRGASAENMLSLAGELKLTEAAILAPQATNYSWYPYSFLAPVEQNQPALDSALQLVNDLVQEVLAAGIPSHQIYFLGFSQGACLALEYATRNATSYGGVIAFTGGLIGQHLNPANYLGDFVNTPVLITTGDPDPHVPLSRVEESVVQLEQLNAKVTLRVYPGRLHTIQRQELDLANDIFFAEA